MNPPSVTRLESFSPTPISEDIECTTVDCKGNGFTNERFVICDIESFSVTVGDKFLAGGDCNAKHGW